MTGAGSGARGRGGGDAASLKAWAAETLRQAGVAAPLREATLLLSHAAARADEDAAGADRHARGSRSPEGAERNRSAWAWSAGASDEVPPGVRETFRRMVERRAGRAPFAHVVGLAEFFGVRLAVTPDVLVPRPETEILLETAVELAQALERSRTERGSEACGRPLRLLDLGTGSGALAIGLAVALPRALVWASDVSEAALAVARRNAASAGVGGRVRFVLSDWWAAWGGADATGAAVHHLGTAGGETSLPELFDGVVCNPPYVREDEWATLEPEVRAEPRRALVAGPTGLECYRAILAGARGRIAEGGFLAFEAGAGQAGDVARLMEAAGFRAVRRVPDLSGTERVVAGRREVPADGQAGDDA